MVIPSNVQLEVIPLVAKTLIFEKYNFLHFIFKHIFTQLLTTH